MKTKRGLDAPVLAVSGLVHRFGERVAVDHLDLEVRAGEIVGLVGRNGAGKTTAMRAVMGILRPLGGQISWHGRPLAPADRLRCGYMPEERGLYPQMRILDQVAYFGELHGLDRATAIDRAQGWLDPPGAGRTRAGQGRGPLPRQPAAGATCRGAVHCPELLVLDEPFAGLDPTAVDTLSDILRAEAARSTAVWFSSHQLDLVERLCHRIVILEEGRVLASGTLEQLQARLPRRLRVKVDGPAAWAADVPGARIVREDAEGVLLELDAGADPQAVLRAAQAAGAVEHFGFESGGLVDLYRQLVSS